MTQYSKPLKLIDGLVNRVRGSSKAEAEFGLNCPFIEGHSQLQNVPFPDFFVRFLIYFLHLHVCEKEIEHFTSSRNGFFYFFGSKMQDFGTKSYTSFADLKI